MRLMLAFVVVVLLLPDLHAQGRRGRRGQADEAATCKECLQVPVAAEFKTSAGSADALSEVNAYRAARGLRAFLPDKLLNQAAQAAAAYRAAHHINGHVPGGRGDFQFLPPGADCNTAGCGALEPSWGWGTCCMDGNYTYAGAAWVMGSDGRRYMHLFVR